MTHPKHSKAIIFVRSKSNWLNILQFYTFLCFVSISDQIFFRDSVFWNILFLMFQVAFGCHILATFGHHCSRDQATPHTLVAKNFTSLFRHAEADH